MAEFPGDENPWDALRYYMRRAATPLLPALELIRPQLWIAAGVCFGAAPTAVQVKEYGIALVLFVASGVSLILSPLGWNGPQRHPLFTRICKVLLMTVGVVLIPLSLLWVRKQKGDEPWTVFLRTSPVLTTPTTSSPSTFNPIPSPDQARIKLTRIDYVTRPFPHLNVVYECAGKLPALGIRSADRQRLEDRALTLREVEPYQDLLLKPVRLTGLDRECYPGDTPQFFSLPRAEGKEADVLLKIGPFIKDKRIWFYLFLGFEYRDRSMPEDVVGITETCVYFFGTFDTYHNCGRQRSFLVKLPKESSTRTNSMPRVR
jgi:hypothetical protein